ncbi:MAG: methyltransferase [Cyclobacteriaceae bacterium]|nr:methyltransferase [Cyclobacteriaceae bacterium]
MAKSNTHFNFKQFAVHHDRCSMKVGTDGVLLGAWTDIRHVNTILDIGTGSGVIALMLAQRTSDHVAIDAVEIEAEDAAQARGNVTQSPWPKKVVLHEIAVQDFFPTNQYELIVSNPPYFNNSWQPPDPKRYQTRHTVTLTYTDLLSAVTRLLSPKGRFSLILPFTEGLHFIELALALGLHCSRQWSFRTRKGKPIERWLLEFSPVRMTREENEIVLYEHDRGEEWSAPYKELTRDFYLKL